MDENKEDPGRISAEENPRPEEMQPHTETQNEDIQTEATQIEVAQPEEPQTEEPQTEEPQIEEPQIEEPQVEDTKTTVVQHHIEEPTAAGDPDADADANSDDAASTGSTEDADDAKSTTTESNTPKTWQEQLQAEIAAGNLEKVEAILDNEDNEGALEIRFEHQFNTLSDSSEGVTPLILAGATGENEIVKLLLKRGANLLEATTSNTYTAFAIAAQEGHFEVVKTLLEHRKESLKEDEKPTDLLECQLEKYETPLMLAAWYGHGEIVDYLIEEGADVTATDSTNNTGLHHAAWEGALGPIKSILKKEPGMLDWRNNNQETAFLLTSRKGQVETADFLLDNGANLVARDSGEGTILHLAAWYGHLEMVKKIMSIRPQFLEDRDKTNRTAFFRACWEGHVDVVGYLMEQGTDVLVKAQGGETALQAATAEGHLDVVQKLYNSHPEFLEMTRDDGQTAMILAAWTKHLDVAKFLMEQKADINAKDGEGDNILNNVVFADTEQSEEILEILQYLLDSGAKIEPNNSGRNAFHIAAYGGKEKIVQMFLDRLSEDSKPEPMPSHYYTSKDDWGDTALTDAADQGHMAVVVAILESPIFYPPLPASDEAYICNEKEVEKVSDLCLGLLKPKPEEESEEDESKADEEPKADEKPQSEETADIEPQTEGESNIAESSETKAELKTDGEPEADDAPKEDESATEGENNPENSEEEKQSDEEEEKEKDTGETPAEKLARLEQHLDVLLYWAVLNGNPEISEICIQKRPDLVHLERGEATWLHIAAIGGNVKIMDHLLEKRAHDQEELVNRLLDQKLIEVRPNNRKNKLPFAEKRITPFHLAVRYSNLEMVEKILSWVDDEPKEEGVSPLATNFPQNIDKTSHELTSVLKTILQATDDGDTPVSLAASGHTGTHRDIEEILWKRLSNSVKKNPWFFAHPLAPEAELVLELAAQYETPREEFYLRKFLQGMPQRVEYKNPKDLHNTLQLAVYHQCPTVVWWLLSNGGYLSENDMRSALELSSQVRIDPFGAIIHELLTDPPPVLKRRARRDDHRPPTFQHARQEYDAPDGTVLDLYQEDQQVTFQIRRRPLHEIIYQDGPQKIMNATQYSNLAALKDVVSGLDRVVDVKSKDKTKEGKAGFDHDGAHQDRSTENAGSRKPTGAAENTKKTEAASISKQKLPDLRWIHLPVNNLQCVEELMVRISRDKDIKNKEHRALSHFIRKSWAELPAGKRKSYMKPQCVHDTRLTDKSHEDNEATGDGEKPETPQAEANETGKRVALYMPYVFWTRWPLNFPDKSESDLSQTTEKQVTQRKPVVHDSLTLDQYYYVSLKDTAKRDRDQVLWRFMEVEKEKLRMEEERKQPTHKREVQTRLEQRMNDTQFQNLERKIETDVGTTQILIVNQLWLWILDDKTIVTSTTREPEGIQASFFQRVLDTLRAQERNSMLSVEYVTELVLSTATGMFNKKEIDFLDLKKSPLDVYRESILNVRDAEAELFDRFRESLKSDQPVKPRAKSLSRADSTLGNTTGYSKWNYQDGTDGGVTRAGRRRHRLSQFLHSGSPDPQTHGLPSPKQASIHEKVKEWWHKKHLDSQKEANPYHDIAREAELLREVKDISDELNMLKNLAEDQEGVWKQFWVSGTAPRTTYTYDTPSEIKGEIEEMIKEAEFVQQAIDTLLDLKQKQANITEAQYTRKQSDDTATQSDTVMVFTVVTILFLPASFLTSLFALNVSDFPHQGENVRYEGYWIFPIIFGVSLLVSGFFAIVAFNASAVKKYFAERSKAKHPKRKEVTLESKTMDENLKSIALGNSTGSDTLV